MAYINVKKLREPKDGEKIFFINTFNVVDECIFEKGDEMLDRLVNCGNYFFNAEDAEFYALKQKYQRLYYKYIEQHGESLDWGNSHKPKYYAYYDLIKEDVGIARSGTLKIQGVDYSNGSTINEAVKFIDKDNFRRYICNIKNYERLIDDIGLGWNLEESENEEND